MRIGFLVLIGLCISFAQAQSAFTLKYFGLTSHPKGDPTAELQPNKLDKNARLVVNVGAIGGYEKFVFKDLYSVKVMQGFLADCSNGFMSVSHIGARVMLYKDDKHRINFGIGPTFVFRESWNRFGSKYTSSGFFNEYTTKKGKEWQWKFVWYAFELEYDYCFNQKDNFSISLIPVFPLALISNFGWKHWIEYKEYDKTRIYVPK
ncbi:MAG: hypothetical protein H6607_03910 [Flavobacteriales bacterium]|nr:hypothetical protein [Flavobacteriales bacterium]